MADFILVSMSDSISETIETETCATESKMCLWATVSERLNLINPTLAVWGRHGVSCTHRGAGNKRQDAGHVPPRNPGALISCQLKANG